MKKQIMVDLETLGRRAGCKILSLGAVVFSKSGLAEEFYAEFKINHQGGLVADPETVAWWDRQDPLVRDRLYANQDQKPTLSEGLETFSKWLFETSMDGTYDIAIWGNGAGFDQPILEHAYQELLGRDAPWKFWDNRCYRTLKTFAQDVTINRLGSHHNALDDAKSQAEHAVRLIERLGLWSMIDI